VQTAQTAERALELLTRSEFDLVLADAHFSGEHDATGFFRWLKAKRPGLAKHLVLMRSAAPAAGNGHQREVQGMRILQKPFKTAELIAAVEEVLNQIHAAPLVP